MSQKHVSRSRRSRNKARQARREAREVRELLKMPVETRRGAHRRAAKKKRRLRRACGWLASLTTMILLGVFLIHQAFYENPQFLLKRVEVATDGTLTKQEILQTAQVPAAINLLEIDLASIDARLRRRSQVRDARVRRKVPDTLEITVWERTPFAWLGYQGAELDKRQGGVLLDAGGHAICCHTLYRDFYDFPVVLVPRDVIAEFVLFGHRVEVPSVHLALELLKIWPSQAPDPSWRIVQIDANRHYRLEVVCQPEVRLLIKPDNFPGQLRKLGDAIRHARHHNRYLARVDLTVTDNIPVIYHQEGFAPEIRAPGQPEVLKPAPRWQPQPLLNNSLSDEELRAILSVDS